MLAMVFLCHLKWKYWNGQGKKRVKNSKKIFHMKLTVVLRRLCVCVYVCGGGMFGLHGEIVNLSLVNWTSLLPNLSKIVYSQYVDENIYKQFISDTSNYFE